MYEMFREYRFEAAHRLTGLPDGHRCARLHGHSFVVQLHLRGLLDERKGWLVDYYDVDLAWAPCHERLDHRYLNEVEDLENPTSERIAHWIWVRVKPALPQLARVVVKRPAMRAVRTGASTRADLAAPRGWRSRPSRAPLLRQGSGGQVGARRPTFRADSLHGCVVSNANQRADDTARI